MIFHLTPIVLILSGIYEGYRLFGLIGSINEIGVGMAAVSADSTAYGQLQSLQSGMITETIVCGVLLLLTVICLIGYVRYVIIKNLSFIFNNVTKDVIKTTNSGNRNVPPNVKGDKKSKD